MKLLDGKRSFERIALGGVPETVHELQKLLPASLANKVIGTFPVEFKHETEEEMLERVRNLEVQVERREEEQLVDAVMDAAKSEGKGTLGIEQTLKAIQEGRVQKLLIGEGLDEEGFVCFDDGYFALLDCKRCPVCGGEATRRNVVDYTVETVFLTGGCIEAVLGQSIATVVSRRRPRCVVEISAVPMNYRGRLMRRGVKPCRLAHIPSTAQRFSGKRSESLDA